MKQGAAFGRIRVLYSDARATCDDELRESTKYRALGVIQRKALDAALADGFLVANVETACVLGAAPGARRLLHCDGDWGSCGALWLQHCRSTARPCIDVTIFPDGLAVVQMRYGATTWLDGKRFRGDDLVHTLARLVVEHDHRRWKLGDLWVTRALGKSDAVELARKVTELDQQLRTEAVCEYVMDT